MQIVGSVVLYIIIGCSAAGGIASILSPDSELGKKFTEGITSVGPIFLSVAGIFAAIPYIAGGIEAVIAPVYGILRADPSMAATTIIAVDMGGYQIAKELATSCESWIMSMFTGFMAGATVVFSVPIGLRMIRKEDEAAFAFGIMSGFLTVPVGVASASIIAFAGGVCVRSQIATAGYSDYALQMMPGVLVSNLIPLIIVCALVAAGLTLFPRRMIKAFGLFGRIVDGLSRICLVLFIVEHFTGAVSGLTGWWGLEPVIADGANSDRALEIAGYTALMLSGAFPLMYLLQKYTSGFMLKAGRLLKLKPEAMTGVVSCIANVLALFPLMKDMDERGKVQAVAFSVCGAFLIGDHLSFTANFQPNLIVPVFCGKLIAAMLACMLAGLLYDKSAVRL